MGPARPEIADATVDVELERLWLELLGNAPGGPDDDFFRAGGDSIRAARFVAHAAARFDRDLSLRGFLDRPTIAGLARLVHESPTTVAPPAPDASRPAEAARCSFAQERFWFIEEASGGTAVTNVAWALRLRGTLDIDALAAAIAGVVARHESLRTRFTVEEGQPVQRVEASVPDVLDVRDVSGDASPEAAATRLAEAAAREPFDLGTAPQIRAHLVQLREDDHVLQLVAHHIVCDDWSKGVLHDEISALYTAALGGDPSPLAPPAVQYADYSERQRTQLDERVLAEELAHWQDRLEGSPPALELPPDRPRPAAPTQSGARLRTTVPVELAESLRALGRGEGATFFVTMLAAFQVLLHRYTGEEDLVIGTAVDNRGRVELENAIGLFTNVLALRTDLSGQPTFRELVRRARATTVDAIAHQDLPFDRLAASMPDRDPSRHPIFQVFYEFIVPAPLELRLPGVTTEPFDVPKHTTEFDLGLYLDEGRGGLDAVWEFSTDLFEPETIERLAHHFVVLLGAIVAEPDRPVTELSLVDAAERQRALGDATGPSVPIPETRVDELFEAQARRTPGLPAVVADGTVLTYGELDERANRLAHLLRELGITAGDTVGLCTDRSVDAIVGVLGIVKAGAAYVPLNDDHPASRLERQLADAGARVLVTQRAVRPPLATFAGEVVLLDDGRLADQPRTAPDRRGAAGDPVYVLYTSGSTGVPKGVSVSHRNLVNYVEHMLRRFTDGGSSVEGWRFASVSAISTDLGNTTIFPSLIGGGCLHVVDAETSTDGDRFAAYVDEHAIDVLKITPSHMRSLLDAAGDRAILPRRWLVLGGEAATWDLVDRVGAEGPRILNHYGPTEATVGCCTFEVKAGTARPSSVTVPIGRPISNATAHVLERTGAPAPVGVPGELHVGGAGVAAGYVGQPDETAERFVPDPFSDRPEARLYRTGDRVRRLADGNIEFLGRVDQQVKIRGFRVEPAEVEAALRRRSGVREAVVLPQGDGEGKRLVAFVVGDGTEMSHEPLLGALAASLPPYMVPARVVAVDAIPLTPNGKVDRRALLAAATEDRVEAADEAAPRTGIEEQLLQIWRELLERDGIGAEDNFFEIGGHSLLAIRLVARLRGDFGLKLTLKTLIEEPTVRALAAKVEEAAGAPDGKEASQPELPAITVADRTHPLRCSSAQEQFWLVDRLTPNTAAYTFSWPMRLRGPLDVSALERAAVELVRRHEILRTAFPTRDGEPMQEVGEVPERCLAFVDVSSEPDREAAAKRLVDAQTAEPFDLERGPLIRLQLIRIAGDDHVFQIVVHHIAFDGMSKVIVYRELGALYAAFAAGRPSELPEPQVQFGDYAEWQRRWLEGEWVEEELGHWQAQLDGAPEALELPTDRPRPRVASMSGARHRTPLPTTLRTALEALGRSEGATFFMVMLAAFDVLLHRYTGQDDLVVGAPVDTRGRPELDDVVGPFLNTIVLRNDLSGAPSFRTLLGRVKERTLDAVSHQELPFERLVEALHPERDLSRHPIYQALIALNPPERELELVGVAVEDVDPDWSAARVDLFLVLDDLPRGLEAVWEYSTDLFDAETIEAMGRHFLRILEAVVADPDASIADVPLVERAELEPVFARNRTEAPVPAGRLEELITAQAAATPDRVAVEFAGVALSYADLDARANAVAHRLRELGVETEDPVGISLGRSADLLVGLLGILKAGGAYVPVDPGYPLERRRLMLEDAGARVIVTEERLVEGLPVADAALLCIDRERDRRAAPPQVDADGNDLAYVIYTSGSTGVPKGVEIPHRALLNFLASMRERPGLAPDDVLVAVTTLSFDIAGLELYLPLITGARVVIASDEAAADPRRLRALLDESGATVMQATPTTWRMLVDSGWPGRPGFRVLCGGEALPPALADELLERGVELWNMYGPTETTIWSSVARVEERGAPLTLGRPIANTSLLVLDDRLSLLPAGVPGEVFIGGAGLARGYRGRPDLTRERFVEDPFGAAAGARLYRTGDVGRTRRDGSIELLGRLDAQVKVRGFRIELAEIETRLSAHPAVAAAVATTVAERQGENALVAYTVPAGAATPAAELRRFLEESLPAYMIPSSFVTLDSLPLTPNGKVDRKRLPAPAAVAAEATSYEPPRTGLEAQLAGLFGELLGRDRVGINENFFDLGGHSLLAARLIGRIAADAGVELPLRALFEGPTVGALARRVEDARGQQPGKEEPPPLVPIARTRRASFAQERFWFVDQFAGGTGAYNISWPHRIHGSLDVAALEKALGTLVARHETLRTRFTVEDGRPMQVVEARVDVPLEIVDLRDDPEAETTARRLVEEATSAPFDLERGPLVRLQLLRLGDEDHVLHLVVHHIAADGWSKTVVLRELGVLYDALASGRPASLPELPLQYGDYAEWQRSWLDGERLELALSHWRRELADLPSALELPTDHPRPAVATMRGAWRRSTLDDATVERLGQLARAEGATLFMVVLAAFNVLLHRYTGQDDIVVGAPVDGRNRPELEPLVGPLVNTLVLRTDLSGAPTFRELLRRVRERTLDAVSNGDVPFERLVEALQPERDPSRHPIFQTLVSLNPPDSPLELAGLAVEPMTTEKTAARTDLTLILQQTGAGLDAVWEYSTDLFDAQTVERLERHFARLLDSIVLDPDRPIGRLPILERDERRSLLELGAPGGSGPEERVTCLHDRFESQADRTPDAVAVSYEGATLTYRQLNERANQLAHRLRGAGVEPETLVALCLERSLELVVAILGVLKAGGAYVPLDPDYPADRLAFILADTRAPVLVTQERLLERGPSYGGDVICLDRDAAALAAESLTNPEAGALPENLAYVIYTSGSTGQPKGVQVEHRNVARLLTSTDAWFGFGEHDVWTLLHSYAFDFSVWELWGALLHGGRLVVVPHWTARAPESLAAMLVDEGVTVLNATPSLFLTALDDLVRAGDSLSLRYVVFGGEALHPAMLRPWFDRFGDDRPTLVNMYGITETTVHVTYRPLSVHDADADRSPIGGPIPDLQLYVLDDELEPVPLGVPGELFVGGAGVARGYLARPELTSERFIADPFSSGRLYRTGDRARRLADGNLVFEGRRDDQVKVRGFRIELGEIQAALALHDRVLENVVVPFDAAPGDTRLVAYVVADGGGDEDGASELRGELRAWLRQKLPEHMVPSSFTFVAAMPLTVNGKLDRKALPAPEHEGQTGGGTAPRSKTEEALVDLWIELLGVERVSVGDDFFELGGHSLLAAQLAARVRDRFGLPLSVRAVFEEPTLEGFARRVDSLRSDPLGGGAANGAGPAPVVPRAAGSSFPLSYSQEQLWLIDQWDPGAPTYNVALPFRIRGRLDVSRLRDALQKLVDRHEALRTTIQLRGETPVPELLDDPRLEVSVVELDGTASDSEREAEAVRLLNELAVRPFDFTKDLMLRATVVVLAEDESLLLIETHHVAFDGWSEAVFFDELAALYEGKEVRVSPLQFGDFSLWQRSHLAGEALDEQLAFWRRYLAGAPESIELPTDRPRPEGRRFRGASHDVALSSDEAAGVRSLCRDLAVTPYIVLLAALSAVLYRTTGQDDVLIGSPFANRPSRELERVIGFFSNTLVFRTRLDGNPTFRELVVRIREQAVEAYAHHEIPFEKIVEALRPQRQAGVNPLFQVNFRVRTGRRPGLTLPGLAISPLRVDVGLTRFDLALDLQVLDEGIEGYFRYNRDIFEPTTIARIARDFSEFLREALADPDRRLLAFELVSEQADARDVPLPSGASSIRDRPRRDATASQST